jgi:hypothetical protein
LTPNSLPNEVRRFIAEHIDSAETLEILLFLQRNPEQGYTAEALSTAVYTVPAAALLRLEALVGQGFASTNGASNPEYRYAPATPELQRQVDLLAQEYRRSRVAVIQTIFETPRSPAQAMADAFRLRGRE